MREYFIPGRNLPKTYHEALFFLEECGEISDCADWNTKQKEISVTMFVENPLAEPMISKCFIGGAYELQQYVMEMLDGILDFEVEKGNWDYTYHQRYADQYQFVIDELRRNPSSRRAVMDIRDKLTDMYSNDPACFCKDTKILTPDGKRNIQDIKDGDKVYSYDYEKDDYIATTVYDCFSKIDECIKITTFFGELDVSKDQKVLTNKGWKYAKEITCDDKILYSDLNLEQRPRSLWCLIGCLIGDGWLTTPTVRARNIRRKDIGLSIHPKSNEINTYNLLSEFTKNKISTRSYVVNSELVCNNRTSKKYTVSDYRLHDLLMNYIPCGRKTSGEMLFDANDMADENIIDFLTGLYSAEGCLSYHGESKNVPFIELTMAWEKCVDMIDFMLNRIHIEHHYYKYKDRFKISITGLYPILQFINSGIDFRYDSRKQIKFQMLKYYCHKTLSDPHYAQNGTLLWAAHDIELRQNSMYVPIDSIETIGQHEVFDFTTEDSNHTIIANNIICHNCMQHIQFFIRDNKLHMKVLFRSNDAVKAAFMNAFALIMLQKRVADELGVEVGTYTHRANSFHCYERDFDLLHNYVKRYVNSEDLTYDYVDDWKDDMEEAIPMILQKVEELKTHE